MNFGSFTYKKIYSIYKKSQCLPKLLLQLLLQQVVFTFISQFARSGRSIIISSFIKNYRNEIHHGTFQSTREARRAASKSPHQNSLQKRRVGPVNLSRRRRIPMGGVSIYVQLHFVPRRRSAGSHHTFPTIPPGITLGQRGERSTSLKWRERGGAHCRPGVRDTRVPRALTVSLSLLQLSSRLYVRPRNISDGYYTG